MGTLIIVAVVVLCSQGTLIATIDKLLRRMDAAEDRRNAQLHDAIVATTSAVTTAATETARAIQLPADRPEIWGVSGTDGNPLPLARVMPGPGDRTTNPPADDIFDYSDPTDDAIPDGHWDGAVSVPPGFSEARARALGIGKVADEGGW